MCFNNDQKTKVIEGIVAFSSKSPLGFKPEAIKINDMTSILRIPKITTVLDKGSWVRVKRGLYAGDLALVHRVDESKSKAWIKLVPRIDYSASDAPSVGSKRKRGNRPPAIHYNSEDAR